MISSSNSFCERTVNRKKKSNHDYNQDNYVADLPNFSSDESEFGQDSTNSLSEQEFSVSNGSNSDSDNFDNLSLSSSDQEFSIEPSQTDYIEAVMSAIMSYGGLNLTQAEITVNLFNILNQRYSSDPINLPNIRYFWDKKSKQNAVSCYILCKEGHAHGPFNGEPRLFGYYVCGNQHIKATLTNDQYFLVISLKKQLKYHLSSFFEHDWVQETDGMDDICSTQQAKKMKSDQESTTKKITLTIHADEVQAGNSSSVKIFPLLISINELRPNIRRKNFFLVSLFVGRKKPNVSSYLGPIVEELSELEKEPISWKDKSGKLNQATFHLICLIADAPMRAYLRHVRQYNHLNGCDWCLNQATSANGARIYANLTRREIDDLKRKHDDFIEFSRFINSDTQNMNPRFKGIIGNSPLLQLSSFNLVDGISVEPMHCLLLGIFRSLILKGWLGSLKISLFDHKRIDKTFFKEQLSQRICKISIPSDLSRAPRDLDQIKHWKSSEYDNFLSYFFVPTIKGLLKPKIYNHVLCLVRIYYLAHKGKVDMEKISELKNLIEEFQIGISTIYGKSFLTYNLHILSHLPDSLENLGPMANVSSYPLEDIMGILKEKVRRSSNIASTLVRVFINDFRYKETISTKISFWKLNQKEKKNFGLCDQRKNSEVTIQRKIGNSEKQSDYLSLIRDQLNIEITAEEIEFLTSVSIGGRRFSTIEYTFGKKRNDSFIKIGVNSFFKIQQILRIKTKRLIGFCEEIQVTPYKTEFKGFTGNFIIKFDHIFEIKSNKEQRFKLIELGANIKKAIFVQSTTFSPKYMCDYLVDAFLFNF